MIGALCGLSQAAAVIIGKMLGTDDKDGAYTAAKKLILYGFSGSFILSAVILLTGRYYVEIYQVEDSVKILTTNILTVYTLIAPFKIQNMILGGGILRSGGKTKYVMFIDLIGTWVFGVPLGLLAAFVLKLPVPAVYFILSLEECVRFAISMVIFRKKGWMTVLRKMRHSKSDLRHPYKNNCLYIVSHLQGFLLPILIYIPIILCFYPASIITPSSLTFR